MEDGIVIFDENIPDDHVDGGDLVISVDAGGGVADSGAADVPEEEILSGEPEEVIISPEPATEYSDEPITEPVPETVLEIVPEPETEAATAPPPLAAEEPVVTIEPIPETETVQQTSPETLPPAMETELVFDEITIDQVVLSPETETLETPALQTELPLAQLPAETLPPVGEVVIVGDSGFDDIPVERFTERDAADSADVLDAAEPETVATPDYTGYLMAIAESLKATHEIESERYELLMSELTALDEKQVVSSNNIQMLLTGVLLAAGLVLGVLVIKVLGNIYDDVGCSLCTADSPCGWEGVSEMVVDSLVFLKLEDVFDFISTAALYGLGIGGFSVLVGLGVRGVIKILNRA